MSIGTFGSFTQARLAIYAAQTGLTVTGNNISNINTPGYTRQRSDQASLYTAGSDRYYSEGDIRVGQGVLVRSISQIRSPYLDVQYRKESANVGYMDAMLDGLNRIADTLDEVGKGDESKEEDGYGILGLEFHKIFDALEQLAEQTGHQEYDATVKAACDSLAHKFNTYAASLQTTYDEVVKEFHENVDKVNGYLTTIRNLNEEIRKCDIHGDNALELRDERNLQIDKLSKIIPIQVDYSMEQFSYGVEIEKLSIRLSNQNPDGSIESDSSLLVDGVFGAQFILEQVPQERDAKELAKLQAANTAKDDATLWPYEDKDHPGLFTNSPTAADGSKNTVNAAFEQYLKADGTTTADKEEARQVDSPNFNITVSELRNKAGRLLYTISEGEETLLTDAAAIEEAKKAIKDGGSTTEMVPNPDDPNFKDIIVRTYRRSGASKIPEPNPAHKADETKPKYLAPDGSATDDPEKANMIDNPNAKYFVTQYYQKASIPVELDDNDLHGELQAQRELLTEGGEFTDRDVIDKATQTGPYRNTDENAGTKRGIVYYQRALDLLANKFANVMNEANQGFRYDNKGNYITTGINPETGKEIGVPVTVKGTDAGGAETADTLTLTRNTSLKDQPPEIVRTLQDATGLHYDPAADNSKELIDAYLMGQKYDANGNPTLEGDALKANAKGIFDGGPLFSNNGSTNDTEDITAANISVSYKWQNSDRLLVNSFECPPQETEPASGQPKNLDHLLYVMDGERHDFVPRDLDVTGLTQNASDDIMFTGTFFDMWNRIGNTLGDDQSLTGTMLDTHYENALQIDTNRDSISAVDFNDEAMNLMMYAKSYNAACRLMTTIDSVLDKLVNNTGLTT